MVNVIPSSILFFTSIIPPLFSSRSKEMESPSPVPSALVVGRLKHSCDFVL
jgi:hypothetical protein